MSVALVGSVAVVGGGPAGLMAATMLARRGHRVILFEGKASPGRKFLLAGRSGLNLTHSEPLPAFMRRYGPWAGHFAELLKAFSPDDLRDFFQELGVETFVGTSGRVFPKEFRASSALRKWLSHLAELGVEIRTRYQWLGFEGECLLFDTPQGPVRVTADATILALGGASWPRMGSDGAWVPALEAIGLTIRPFEPANCGVRVNWSSFFRDRFAGSPLKTLVLHCGASSQHGEVVVTEQGLEGGGLYPLIPALREQIALTGTGLLHLDLKRDLDETEIKFRLSGPRGGKSLSTALAKWLHLPPVAIALLRETLSPDELADSGALARGIKALPVLVQGLAPLDKAISSAGGVAFEGLDSTLMVRGRPGLFLAGEMLEWEAPTGGYLLQGCFSTGWWAGLSAAVWLNEHYPPTGLTG